MPSSWAVAAAQRILNHLDVEDFPNPLADIIDKSHAIGNPLAMCGECDGWFPTDRLFPDSAHPEAPAVCDRCIQNEKLLGDLHMYREANMSSMNRNAELRDILEGARGIMYRYRDCRRFGVGMLQGDHINLDDDVDAFLARTGGDPLHSDRIEFMDGLAHSPVSAVEALREIASRKTDDPVLANLIAGIRHGLELADSRKDSDATLP